MYKEILIIITVIVLIITGNFLVQKYLNQSSHNIVSKLETLNKEIENQEQINLEKVKKLVEDIEKEWKTTGQYWAIVVMHSELDQIEIGLINTKTAIETDNIKEGIIELQKSIFLLKHVGERDSFKLKNIF